MVTPEKSRKGVGSLLISVADEEEIMRWEEIKELEREAIKNAEQATRIRGRGYALGIPIAIFCASSPFLPF